MRETDPINNLKRKYYKNSNKPLGDEKSGDLYSKRQTTTIKALNSDLKDKGLLSGEKSKNTRDQFKFEIGDKDNSMLKSDIDIDENTDLVNGIIIE